MILLLPSNYGLTDEKIFSILGCDQLFGDNGLAKIEGAISLVNNDPNQAKSLFTEYFNDVQKIITAYNGIKPFARKNKKEFFIDSDKNIIKLFFLEDASITFLEELGKTSSSWNKTFIPFALAANENDRNLSIESAQQGSLVLTLSAAATIVWMLAKATDKILDNIKKAYEIKKIALEIKKLKNENLDGAIKDLETNSQINISRCLNKYLS